ncbi:hypothetical protein MADP12_00082 [Mycoplasma anatis]|uniref:oligosaccharide repeat unit polymerase n=1 Tax=Mycoplasmopsis anatis TaxID=171279 RepID=UPI001C4EBE0A|nr:oligosaccharide repeat unit polymerase [Mycoplasmopsis anatis]MBW0599456.1 hypothetical protein [Mycoplasmopsis anatis]
MIKNKRKFENYSYLEEQRRTKLTSLFKLFKNRQVFNELKIPYVEQLNENNKILTKKLNLKWHILSLVIIFLVLAYSLIASIVEGWFFLDLYKYSIGMYFGNSFVIFLILAATWIIIKLVLKNKSEKAFTLFSRIRKVNVITLQNVIKKILILLFFIITLGEHIVLHFIFNANFEFNVTAVNLYKHGWYYISGSNVNYPNSLNNVGMLLDSIYNIFYYISLSSILPILIWLFLLVFLFINAILVEPKKVWKVYMSKGNSLDSVKEYMNSRQSVFVVTKGVQMYFYTMMIIKGLITDKLDTINFAELKIRLIEKTINTKKTKATIDLKSIRAKFVSLENEKKSDIDQIIIKENEFTVNQAIKDTISKQTKENMEEKEFTNIASVKQAAAPVKVNNYNNEEVIHQENMFEDIYEEPVNYNSTYEDAYVIKQEQNRYRPSSSTSQSDSYVIKQEVNNKNNLAIEDEDELEREKLFKELDEYLESVAPKDKR